MHLQELARIDLVTLDTKAKGIFRKKIASNEGG